MQQQVVNFKKQVKKLEIIIDSAYIKRYYNCRKVFKYLPSNQFSFSLMPKPLRKQWFFCCTLFGHPVQLNMVLKEI